MSQGQVPPDGSSKPSWRSSAPAGTGAQTAAASARGKKLVGLLVLLFALAGAVAAMLLYLRGVEPPDFVSLAIREYKSPIFPPNSLALEDSLVLEKRFAAGIVERPYNIQDGEGVLRVLRDLRKKTSRPVVVHLSALARYRDGKVFVLGDDAEPDRMDTWVPLGDVLQKLRECPARNKLLILDIMRTGPDEGFGLFADDIAGRVNAALAREKDLPFLILVPCSPGQSALVSEELGQSLFTYYLGQGLRGHAEGYGPHGKQDWRITVTELADYVQRHVDRLAWETQGVRQTPVLLGQGDDFPLVQFEDPVLDADNAPAAAYPAWLREGWALRDKWRKEISLLGPGILREWDAVLLRAEQRWRGGIEEPRLKSALQTDRQRLEAQVQRIADSRLPPLPRSLSPGTPAAQKNVAAFSDSLRILLPKAPHPALKVEEKDKAKKEELDKEIKAVQALLNKQPLDAAQALFETAAAMPKLGPAQVILLHQLLHDLPRENDLPLETRYAQTVYLDRVRAFEGLVRNNDWDWPMPAVQQALRTTREAERALAEIALDPATLPWVVDLLKNADDTRRAGEKSLFAGLPTEWTKAGRDLKEAAALYGKVQIRAQNVRKARAVLGRAFGLLSSLAPALAAQPGDNYPEAKAWKDAVLAAQKLADAVAKPDPAETSAALDGVTALGQNLDDLERFFEGKVNRCLKGGDDGLGENYQEIEALLDSPWLDGPRREALWGAGHMLAHRLVGKVQALDKAEILGKPSAFAPPGTERSRLQKQLRFQQAIDMITLAGFHAAGSLEKEFQTAVAKADEEAWLNLAEKLSDVWPRQLLADFKTGDQHLLRADRLGRALSPFDLATVRSTEPGHWSQNPSLALYRRDLAALWQWLGNRYQADSAALDATSPFRTIYREWAEEYGGMAAATP